MSTENAADNTANEITIEDIGNMDNETVKKILDEQKAKAEENLEGWKRAQADFVNYKRRVEQEKEELIKSANAGLVCTILPVLDDMERAFESMPETIAEEPWVEGIQLIERKLRSCLESQGLCQINAMGECFDPHLHDAVRQGKGKEGIVVEEAQKGYTFNDKVIRPSKVIVGTGEEEEA